MTDRVITTAEFGAHLRNIKWSGFRLETRPGYALTYEAGDFALFLQGRPRPPEQLEWWRTWLQQVEAQTAAGAVISRVRITDNPMTDYQRWELWGVPSNTRAGEQINMLDRTAAINAGLPVDHDWWLLDEGTADARLLVIRHDDAGKPITRTLITDPGKLARYGARRNLAVRLAHPAAEHSTAA